MTSAPKSDSTVAAAGAAMKLAQSRTFSPSKMPFSIGGVAPLSFVLLLPLFPYTGIAPAHGQGYTHLTDVGRRCNAHRDLSEGRPAAIPRQAPQAGGFEDHPSPESSAALPPAAAVLMVTVCSVAKRAR